MKTIILFAIGAMMMAPSAAFADESAAAKRDPSDRWICKVERMTGSLTRSKRTCMKASEWDKLANDTGNAVNKYAYESNRPDRVPLDPQKGTGWQ